MSKGCWRFIPKDYRKLDKLPPTSVRFAAGAIKGWRTPVWWSAHQLRPLRIIQIISLNRQAVTCIPLLRVDEHLPAAAAFAARAGDGEHAGVRGNFAEGADVPSLGTRAVRSSSFAMRAFRNALAASTCVCRGLVAQQLSIQAHAPHSVGATPSVRSDFVIGSANQPQKPSRRRG